MKRICFCDTETFSEVDIGKCGSYRYIEDNSTEVLLLTYAFGDEPVKCADLASGDPWPEEFLAAYDDSDTLLIAHNCSGFEWPLFNRFLHPLPPERYFDTMHLAAQCGLPQSLGGAGEAIGLTEEQAKIKDGRALIRYFCTPCKPTKSNGQRERNLPEHDPEKWTRFKEYAVRDVEAMRTIYHHLEQWMPDAAERRFWALDARINAHGVRIDRKLATNAVLMDAKNKEELTAEAIALTGMENPKSVSQIKSWLYDQEGKEFPSLNKKVLADVIPALKSEDAKQFMALRTELSKSSTAKYNAMLRSMSPKDDHVRGCFRFYGANRTGRFAGALVQFQNLSKNYDANLDGMRELVKGGHYTALKVLYDGVADPLSQLVRTAIIPEEGHKILVADFSAIEARVTAWFAGEEWKLQAFRDGQDIYCATASQMFHVPVVKHGINGELRQKGKVAELACIAEDELVLTDRGLVPIQNVTLSHRVWDGREWVAHDGVVCRGEKEVVTYGGLTATPDHMVFIEGSDRPVQFGDAAARGARLLQSGAGGADVLGVKSPDDLTRRASRVYDIINAGTRHRFTVSGVLVHNCGYGGGVNALKAFGADKMGMTDEEMQDVVDKWRDSNANVAAWWKTMENAAVRAVARQVETVDKIGGITFAYENGVLFMKLPSGRRLAYWGAAYGESRFQPGRKTLSYMGVNQQTKKWSRVETWGGKLVENCWAAGTLVCTNHGWIPIEKVARDDLIWDGFDWVKHDGAVCRGSQRTMSVDGERCTPDHKIRTTRGWQYAKDCDGLDRLPVQLPADYRAVGSKRLSRKKEVACAVPELRDCAPGRLPGHSEAAAAEPSGFLRLQEKRVHRRGKHNTRAVGASGVGSVAQHEAEMHRPEPQGLGKLWWPWYHRVRELAKELRSILVRHGSNVQTGAGAGSPRKQRGLLPGKLPMGNTPGEHAEPALHAAGREGKCARTGGKKRDRTIYPVLSHLTRRAGRLTVDPAGREEPVYDLLNCGERHQFVILTRKGPLIVHNCVQATARDVLREAMFALDEQGYQVIAHVHDECIVTEPITSGRTYEDMAKTMCPDIPWAKGLPLEAAGYDGDYYFKD